MILEGRNQDAASPHLSLGGNEREAPIEPHRDLPGFSLMMAKRTPLGVNGLRRAQSGKGDIDMARGIQLIGLTGVLFVLGMLMLPPSAFAANVVYDNGLVNEINDDSVNDTLIKDSVGGDPTTLNINPLGFVQGFLTVQDTSIVNLLGGQIQNASIRGNSLFTMSGGSVINNFLTFDTSTLVINSGSSISGIGVNGKSFVVVHDIVAASIVTQNSGMTNLFGGTYGLLGVDTLTSGAPIDVDPVLNIFGGSGTSLEIHGTGIVNIYGSGFNYPFGAIPDLAGVVTGTLFDGSPLNIPFIRHDETAPINLIDAATIPLPAAAWMGVSMLTGMGTITLVRRKQRSR